MPIACVVVDGSGYDFGSVKQHLEQLSERLDAASLEQLTTVLSQLSPPRSVSELQTTLAALIPHIISVGNNPEGSDHELAATIHDIRDKQRLLAQGESSLGSRMSQALDQVASIRESTVRLRLLAKLAALSRPSLRHVSSSTA
jgi:transcriptional regulator of heat shock response